MYLSCTSSNSKVAHTNCQTIQTCTATCTDKYNGTGTITAAGSRKYINPTFLTIYTIKSTTYQMDDSTNKSLQQTIATAILMNNTKGILLLSNS